MKGPRKKPSLSTVSGPGIPPIHTIYVPGACLSSIWWLNPPKQGLFQSKQGSFGFQVHIHEVLVSFSFFCSPKIMGGTWSNLTGISFRFVAKRPTLSYIMYCEPAFVSTCVILSYLILSYLILSYRLNLVTLLWYQNLSLLKHFKHLDVLCAASKASSMWMLGTAIEGQTLETWTICLLG